MAALVEPISMALNCRQVQNLLKEVIAHEAEVQSSTNPNHSKLACSASAVGMFSDLVVRSNKNDTDSDSDADSDSSDNDDENDESENGAGSDAGFAALAVSNNRVPSLLIPLPSTGTGTGTSAGAGATATQKTCLIIPSAILMQSTSTPTPTSLSAIASLALQASISLSKDTPSKSKSLVILLRSGAFASAVFTNCDAEPILHSTKKRYTVRKGQGGAQGSNDSNNGKAKSIGAQLRRDGEKKLWIDVRDTLVKWHAEVAACDFIFIGGSKSMIGNKLFDLDFGVSKSDPRIKKVNIGVEKVSFESLKAVFGSLTTVKLRQMAPSEIKLADGEFEEVEAKTKAPKVKAKVEEAPKVVKEKPAITIPLTPIHHAASNPKTNLEEFTALLQSQSQSQSQPHLINLNAGPELTTALHLAASNSDPALAARLVQVLMVTGGADPTVVDSHGRVAYYHAANDKVREGFRLARGEIELSSTSASASAFDWAKSNIPSGLTNSDVEKKKEKEKEKKKAQRERQKLKKGLEKEAEEQRRVEEEKEAEEERRAEEMKRVRAGLAEKKHKQGESENVCDFCGTECRRRRDMFNRLDWWYCSSECVKKHQRELSAQAAMARFK